ERETQQESAEDARERALLGAIPALASQIAKMYVAVEPPGKRRSRQEDQRNRNKLGRHSRPGVGARAQPDHHAGRCQSRSQSQPRANRYMPEPPDQMQPKEDDHGPGKRSQ